MVSRGTKMCTLAVVALVITMSWGEALAQTGCTSAIVSLSPCLSFISGSSSSPSSSCCSQLSNVVQSQALCLCQVLNGRASSFGVPINQTQALALPGACKVRTPPVSQCNTVNPSAGPAASPMESPTDTPADALTPEASATPDAPSTISSPPSARTGSKSTTSSTSNGKITKLSIHLTLFLIFVASSGSAIIRM